MPHVYRSRPAGADQQLIKYPDMLQISFIQQHKQEVIAGLKKKLVTNAEIIVEQVLEADQARRNLQAERDSVLADSNSRSRIIGALMKEGKREEAEAAKQETAQLKQRSKELNEQLGEAEKQLTELLLQIPNVPHPSVPEGRTAEDNTIELTSGGATELPENAMPHWELLNHYQLADFELGNKVTGAGFPFYTGQGARLQRALINFFLDEATAAGYREIQPPVLVNADSAMATGQLPDKEGQMYQLTNENLYLIPTAEVPVTNMFRDAILNEDELPLKLTAYSSCFRREAGSWGADVRGLNRLHQFDKVEIVQIAHPDDSYQTLMEMRSHIEGLLKKLELHFRVLLLCGGDISFNAALCYDMEVFSAAQKRWLEVSSVSNFETFQANRMKLRYRNANRKTQLVHTLNGSALALPRIMAALLENNQTPEGIKIPAVLQPYCGFEIITR